MADFNAGSIEGSVDLNLDPFLDGLRRARVEAEKFEHERITAQAHVSGYTSGLGDANATVGVDDSEFHRALDEDNLELDKIDHKRATAEVRVDNSQASAALAALSRSVDNVAGAYKSSGPSAPGTGHGLMAIIGLAASLAPAFGPAIGAMGLFGAAGVAGMGAAAASMLLYGSVVKGAFTNLQDAIKAGKQLPGVAGIAENALKGLTKSWGDLQKQADPGIYRVLAAAMNTASSILPKLLPLINAISSALLPVIGDLGALFNSPVFTHFIAVMSNMAKTTIPEMGDALTMALGGAMNLFEALSPVIKIIASDIDKAAHAFNAWSSGIGPVRLIQGMLEEIKKYGPETVDLMKNLGGALVNIGKGVAPLTGPALKFLDTFAKALRGINLAPLAKGIGTVLDDLDPFVKVLGNIVNILLPPLGKLLQTIGDDFVGPLGKSLITTLNPALHGLAQMLNYAAPFLGQIISSFADLVTPTGVGLVATLIAGLTPIIKTLLPPVTQLVVALESMVDDALNAIAPAIRPTLGVLGSFAKAIAPVISALAWVLSHKTVADVLLGIGAGIKAISIASGIVTGIQGMAAALGAVMAEEGAVGIMSAIAAVSPGLAAGIGMVGTAFDVMLGPVGLIILAIAALGVGVVELVKHWSSVQKFFDKVGGAIKDGVGDALGWLKKHWDILAIIVAPFAAIPIEIIKHWSTVEAFLKKIPGEVKGVFSDAASWLKNAGSNIISGLWSAMKSAWATGWGWADNLYGWITGIFSGAGQWLWNEGKAIIQGLWDGMKDVWGDATGWLGSLGGTIKSLKGPLEKDRVLLVPEGQAIIGGLHTAMRGTWDQTVAPWLSGRGAAISGAFSSVRAAVPNIAAVGAVSAAGASSAGLGVLHTDMQQIVAANKAEQGTLLTALQALIERLIDNDDRLSTTERELLRTLFQRQNDVLRNQTDRVVNNLKGKPGPTARQTVRAGKK